MVLTDAGRHPPSSTFRALGMTISVLTVDPRALAPAESQLRAELDELDRACSRFRPGSELSRAEQAGGTPVHISQLLTDLLAAAIGVAELTGGAVDPTVGNAVASLGYDMDFAAMAKTGPATGHFPMPAPGWRCIDLDAGRRLLRVPPGVRVDLGSTAKAFAADRAAERISARLGTGALVNLGGDIAVAGSPPPEGWRVGLALDSALAPEGTGLVVAIRSGGLASSGTGVRAWRRGDRVVHHIVDPRTGGSADSPWVLVSATAGTCLRANAATTAAIVLGEEAPQMLSDLEVPARLVRQDGAVVVVGGWPPDPEPERSGPPR